MVELLLSYTLGLATYWGFDKPCPVPPKQVYPKLEVIDTTKPIKVGKCFEYVDSNNKCEVGDPRYVFSVKDFDTIKQETIIMRANIQRCKNTIENYNKEFVEEIE